MSKTTQQRISEWSLAEGVIGSIAGAAFGLSPHLTRDAKLCARWRDWV